MEDRYREMYRMGDEGVLEEYAREIRRRGEYEELNRVMAESGEEMDKLKEEMDRIKKKRTDKYLQMVKLVTATFPEIKMIVDCGETVVRNYETYVEISRYNSVYVPLDEVKDLKGKYVEITYRVVGVRADISTVRIRADFKKEIYVGGTPGGNELYNSLGFRVYLARVNAQYGLNLEGRDYAG